MRAAQCSSRPNGARKPLPGPRMSHDRLVPLILAVALFMENMDSTVIATSLPAIAADIGAEPARAQARDHLLPAVARDLHSGRAAGSPTASARAPCSAPRSRSSCSARSAARSRNSLAALRRRAHRAGHGRRDDDSGRPAGAGALIDKRTLVDAMAWVTMPALIGPIVGPPVGGFITTYVELALDLPDQRADRPARHRARRRATSRTCGSRVASASTSSASRWRARARRPRLRAVGRRARPAAADRRSPALVAAGALFMVAYVRARAAHAGAGARLLAVARSRRFRATVIGGVAVPPRHRRAAVPAAADAAARLRLTAVPVRPRSPSRPRFGAFAMKSFAARDPAAASASARVLIFNALISAAFIGAPARSSRRQRRSP